MVRMLFSSLNNLQRRAAFMQRTTVSIWAINKKDAKGMTKSIAGSATLKDSSLYVHLDMHSMRFNGAVKTYRDWVSDHTWPLIQRPHYQLGNLYQDPEGNWATWRPTGYHKEMPTEVVWTHPHSPCLAKSILQGTVKGGRRQGRQKKRWEDNIREWTDLEFTKSQ